LNKRRYFVIIITSKAIKDSEGYAGGIGAEIFIPHMKI
jgi:hypothetical protein